MNSIENASLLLEKLYQLNTSAMSEINPHTKQMTEAYKQISK